MNAARLDQALVATAEIERGARDDVETTTNAVSSVGR